jgi:hypothetical protein
MFFHGSTVRFATLEIVKSEGFMPFFTSAHSNGAEAVASGVDLKL